MAKKDIVKKGLQLGKKALDSVPKAKEEVAETVVETGKKAARTVKDKQPKVAEAVEQVAPKLLKAERSQKKILEFNIKAVKDLNPNLTGDALDEKSLAMFNRSMNAKGRPLLNIKEFKALKNKYQL